MPTRPELSFSSVSAREAWAVAAFKSVRLERKRKKRTVSNSESLSLGLVMLLIFILDINRAPPQRSTQPELITTFLLYCGVSLGAPGLPLVAPPLAKLLENVEAAREGGNERDNARVRRLHCSSGEERGANTAMYVLCVLSAP